MPLATHRRLQSFPASWAWPTGTTVLAVLLMSVLAGSRVEASCGHYVKRLGSEFMPGASKPADVPCTCQGSECHRSPLTPVPTAPRSPERQPRGVVTHSDAIVPRISHSDWLPGDFSAAPLPGYPPRLDRPPTA